MKLNRREFLRGLAAVGAGVGAVLAGVGGQKEIGKETVILDPHVPLEPFVWTPSAGSSTSSASVTLGSNSLSHELLSDAHPDAQLLRQFDGLVAIDIVPGSKIKAGDLLAIDGLGSVKPALPGDWPIGFAVADADTHEVIMQCSGLE